MFKSEEHKLDKLEQELLNIEKIAKNLDLNSKDQDNGTIIDGETSQAT